MHENLIMPDKRCIAAGVSRAGARTGLQLQGRRETQGFNSSSPAFVCVTGLPSYERYAGIDIEWLLGLVA